MSAFNPYAADESTVEQAVPQYAMPQMRDYAAPDLSEGDAYNDEFGWAPELRTSTTDTPSAQRIGSIPRMDMRPDPRVSPEVEWRKRDRDDASRHSVEDVRATPWDALRGVLPGDRRWAPNPRSTPPAESRVTSSLAPRGYSFTRPFDQFNRTHAGDPPTGSARSLNGLHFSMADHRRNYDVAEGWAPVRSSRNTYRIEPQPWDTNVVDLPPDNVDPVPSARLRSIEVPSGSRSWRLQ